MATGTVLACVFAVILLYALVRILAGPLRPVAVLLLYLILGVILLLAANWAAGRFNAGVAVNPYTIAVAGFLNIPGVILLFLLRYWLRF